MASHIIFRYFRWMPSIHPIELIRHSNPSWVTLLFIILHSDLLILRLRWIQSIRQHDKSIFDWIYRQQIIIIIQCGILYCIVQSPIDVCMWHHLLIHLREFILLLRSSIRRLDSQTKCQYTYAIPRPFCLSVFLCTCVDLQVTLRLHCHNTITMVYESPSLLFLYKKYYYTYNKVHFIIKS